MSKLPALFPVQSITVASWQYLSCNFSIDPFWMARNQKCTGASLAMKVRQILSRKSWTNSYSTKKTPTKPNRNPSIPMQRKPKFLDYIGNCNASVKTCETRKALEYSCEVHLQSIYGEKEEELHKSYLMIKDYRIFSVWKCTAWAKTLQLLRLKTFCSIISCTHCAVFCLFIWSLFGTRSGATECSQVVFTK